MSQEEKGGCLKLIIGLIVCAVGFAVIYFVLVPLAITITPLLLVGFIIIAIILGIASIFDN